MSDLRGELGDLARELRSLQLPLDPETEHAAPSLARDTLASAGIPLAEQADALAADAAAWEEDGRPPPRLKQLVETVLHEGVGAEGAAVATGYFRAHHDLCERSELDFGAARKLLSAARLIVHLLQRERMSCAQAARVLSAPFQDLTYNWEQIQFLASRLDVRVPELTPQDVQSVVDRDRVEHVGRFADSTAEVELALLVEAAQRLGFSGDAPKLLEQLGNPAFDAAVMVLLHFMLTVCEFYDHPLTVLYEFRPRGAAFDLLQKTSQSYEARGNAALNIAKSAVALNAGWAWGRKPRIRGDALVLVGLLTGMEEMHYPARRELASWLRQWIVRIQERDRVEPRFLDWVGADDTAFELAETLAQQPTATYGTVEQRLVDAASAFLHPEPAWSSRGRKDSVNATNLSRRKTGDCEYVSRDRPVIVGYEAHAGALTEAYIEGHIRSLEQVIEIRRGDLEARAGASDWSIRVIFVAHEAKAPNHARQAFVDDFSIDIELIDYEELLMRVQLEIDALPDGIKQFSITVNSDVIGALNELWTPQAIRDRVIDLIEARNRK